MLFQSLGGEFESPKGIRNPTPQLGVAGVRVGKTSRSRVVEIVECDASNLKGSERENARRLERDFIQADR